eukprot:5295550-Prymnesium_polylepis.1
MNGCNVIDEEGLVSNSLLPPAVVAATLEFAASEPVTAAVYSGDEALVDTSNALTERLVGVGDAPVRQVDDLSVALGSTGKILLLVRAPRKRTCSGARPTCRVPFVSAQTVRARTQFEESVDGVALRSALAGAVGEGAGLTQALSWMLEVVPSGVNKATAVRALLERWNISPEEAVAIGDGENDAEMLAFVGMGIAMGNGGAAAKAAAQHTVPSNREDGFSVAMEEHVLAQLDKA